MKNYHEMTDHEINKEVAGYFYDSSWLKRNGDEWGMIPDYCTNPSDAYEIILQTWDKLMTPVFDSDGAYICTEWQAVINFSLSEPNPLRAAMIVFLMIKDRENS